MPPSIGTRIKLSRVPCCLAPIPLALEVEPQAKHAAVKRALKALLVPEFPVPLDNLERDVLLGQ